MLEKLNNVLGYFTAMSFDKPELSTLLEIPLNELSEVINEVEELQDELNKSKAQIGTLQKTNRIGDLLLKQREDNQQSKFDKTYKTGKEEIKSLKE